MKRKDEISKYAPWEIEEQAGRKSERGGSVPPHTSQKSRVRSKPKTDDQEFLNMYILAREKERVERYGKTLGRRQRSIATDWKEAKSLMYHLQRRLPETNDKGIEEIVTKKKEMKSRKKKAPGNLKKVDWEY